ncbi:MAG TPA: hypothetical protein VHL11_05760 [Phototrophicaceae bacterium]|nr:hypothetical protein [Phototrophicaceae bacterium]
MTFTHLTAASLPWDAVPSPDGTMIYYTATSDQGQPAVFSIPTAGGNPVELAQGEPFVNPLGIAISTDGETLYIADPWSAGSNGNFIYALSTSIGEIPALINGTQGTTPQGLTVASRDGVDQLYFTGIDPATGQPAVYQIAAGGGQASTIISGTPLIAPSGIEVAKDGTIYVLDRLASRNGLGSVIRISSGTVEKIADNIRTGAQLAGLSLTLDESLLLVSSLDSVQETAQVLVIDLATLNTSIINDVIGQNTAAGGLHRAYLTNQYAWADSSLGKKGGVYGVILNP